MRAACFNPTFSNPPNALGASSAPLILTAPHFGTRSFLYVPTRPFIPLWGLSVATIDGNAVYSPLTVAANQTVNAKNSLLELAIESYRASVNYVKETAGSNFGSYETQYKTNLYSIVSNPIALGRFIDLYTKIFNFWTAADPAWTASQYYANRTALINKLIAEADKELYIPPNDYFYDTASAFGISYAAWLVESPTLAAIECLELYT